MAQEKDNNNNDDASQYSWPAPEERSLIGKRISRVDGPVKVSGQAKYTYDVHRPGMLYGKVLRSPYAHAKVVSVDTSAAEKMPGVKAVHVVQGPDSEIHWAGDDIVVVAAVDEGSAADAIRAVKVQYEPLPHFVDDFKRPGDFTPDNGGLSARDIDSMVDNGIPEKTLIARIEERGVSFVFTPQVEAWLVDNEVPAAVIAAAKSAKVNEAAKTDSPYKKAAEQVKGDPDAAFKQAEVISEGVYGCPVITHCCLESHGSIAEW